MHKRHGGRPLHESQCLLAEVQAKLDFEPDRPQQARRIIDKAAAVHHAKGFLLEIPQPAIEIE